MTASPRAAAYTRTGILRKFLEQLSDALPARVDAAYAEQRLGLKGGDVRAFLQSLRVLGLIDSYGNSQERARRMRAVAARPALVREALAEAYPELVERWTGLGGMPREEVEDFFKVEYGLSASSAGPAAKLFSDLMREYGERAAERGATRPFPERSLPTDLPETRAEAQSAPRGGGGAAGVAEERDAGLPEARPAGTLPLQDDLRLAALETIKASLRIDINAEWDEARIRLVFDRMERLVGRIIGGGGPEGGAPNGTGRGA